MKRQSSIPQCFKVIAFAVFTLRPAPGFVSAQGPKPSLPDPVKFINKFEVVWNVARWAVDDMGLATELEDKKGGRITTKPYEFITGTLTASEIDKVALKRDSITGTWLRARYTAEMLVEIITPTQTIVTVRTKMEGLNREIDGSEKWLPLEPLGVFEKRILGKMSMKLLGSEGDFGSKKGFWDRSPESPDNRKQRPFPTRPPGDR